MSLRIEIAEIDAADAITIIVEAYRPFDANALFRLQGSSAYASGEVAGRESRASAGSLWGAQASLGAGQI